MRCELASQRNMWKTEAFVHYVTLHEEDETLVHVEEGGGDAPAQTHFRFTLPASASHVLCDQSAPGHEVSDPPPIPSQNGSRVRSSSGVV